MSNDKSPAFLFYVDKFIQGTIAFDTDQIGAYILLLCYQWDNGFVPSDEKTLKKIARIPIKKLQKVLEKFTLTEDNKYINNRIEIEREKLNATKKERSNSGAKGAEKRWQTNKQKDSTAIVLPLTKQQQTDSITLTNTITTTSINTNTICALEKKINKYFNLNEITHYQQMSEVGRFVTFLTLNNRAESFEKEFDAYCQYKTLSGTQVHGVRSFLGTPEKQYKDGGHCADNWQEALTKQKLKNGNTKRNNTGAEPSYKPTNADDKPFVHRY